MQNMRGFIKMISKNFYWWLVLVFSSIAIIIIFMYENWFIGCLMILTTGISFFQYLKYRKLGM